MGSRAWEEGRGDGNRGQRGRKGRDERGGERQRERREKGKKKGGRKRERREGIEEEREREGEEREGGKGREKERGRSRAGQELGAGNLENGLGEPDREGTLSKPLIFTRIVKNILLSHFSSLWLVLSVHEVQITCIENFCPW